MSQYGGYYGMGNYYGNPYSSYDPSYYGFNQASNYYGGGNMFIRRAQDNGYQQPQSKQFQL